MKSQDTQVDEVLSSKSVAQTLREQAEKKAWDVESRTADSKSPKAARMLAHELRVHQIELEMQNDELHRTRAESENSRARYFDLYELAPTGYCTLNEKGLILEANLAAATLLGTPRSELVNQSISRFILKEDQDSYYLHRKQLFETASPQTYELRMVRSDGTVFWVHFETTVARSENGETVCRLMLNDVTERRAAEEALRESEALLKEAQRIAGLGSYVLNLSTELWSGSDVLYKVFGIDKAYDHSVAGWLALIHPDDCTMMRDYFRNEVLGQRRAFDKEYRIIRHDDQVERWVCGLGRLELDPQGNPLRMYGTVQDITERKLVDIYREMDREVLQILNTSGDLQTSIQHVLAVMKTHTGFDAVGIRLENGDDFPYLIQQGFSDDFLLKENTLISRGEDGCVCRDKDGKVSLECTCGLVLSGKIDPLHPSFTKGGSFWNNDTGSLLSIPPDQETRTNPRNECIYQGYASVALIPIRNKDRVVGLIQFNDRRKGRFTPTTIELLERVAEHIGEALLRKQTEDALHVSEFRYRRLFEAAQDGILILDAESGQIRDVNPFLVTMLGYTREELVGRKLWEIGAFGDIQKNWDEFRQLQIEEYVRYEDIPLVRKDGTLFEVEFVSNVYLVNDKKVIQCNIRDITERRQIENTLRFLAQGTGIPVGESFFQALARYLTETLDMDFVCIDRLDGDGLTARTVAVWCDGKFEDNVVYALKDTPCGEVVGKAVCCFPASVCSLFPRDAVLQDLRADSYAGVTLWNHAGLPIGLIAVIGRKPMANQRLTESVLKLVAVRAASELERELSDAAIRDVALFPEQNPSPILRVGGDGRLQYANLSAGPLLLHWNGIEIGDAVPPQIAVAVTEALSSGTGQEIEMALGSRQLSFVLTPISGCNYVNLYGRDITTLKHAQAREKELTALAAASQTAVNIIESIGEAVLLLTMDGHVKSVNPALEKMIGIPAREMVGQTLSDFFPSVLLAEEYKIVEAALADVLCGQIPSLPHLTLISRKDHRVPIIPSVNFLLDGRNNPMAIVITLRNISTLRNAQKALEDSEQKYRELVENSNSIIIRITADHEIVFSNEYAQKFFGYTAKELLGKNIRDTIIPEIDSEGRNLHEMLTQITAHPERYEVNENENICKDGRRVWVHWTNRFIRDEQGDLDEIFCVGTDITEQKKAQQIAAAYQAELKVLFSKLTLVEERARHQLSVALHDTVGQTITLSKIKLGALGRMLTEEKPKAALAEIRKMFEEAVRQTRALSFELSPPILYELGCAAAVEWLGEDFGKRYGFRVNSTGTDQKYALSETVGVLFFQSARELFTNIVKHAQATEVNLSLAMIDGQMTMEVRDNGKGFNPDTVGGKNSMGLFSIRERMRHIGGTFEIQSGRKGGTIAKLSAPMGAGAS